MFSGEYRTSPRQTKPSPMCLHHARGSNQTRHVLVANIQGTITLARNNLVNSAISILKVRKIAVSAKCSGVT